MPEFKEPTNVDRAAWAAQAIENHDKTVNAIAGGEHTETILSDLLADLMHFADREKIPFHRALKMAMSNYKSEVA